MLAGRDDLDVLLLAPADPLHPRRIDDYFAPEATAATELGCEVRVIDHDALALDGGVGKAVRFVDGPSDDAVYRGWMIRSEQYRDLAEALQARGVRVRVSPAAYQAAHELPGWYEAFKAHTAPTVWLDRPGTTGLAEAVRSLPPGPGVVKDWVKSMKHYWEEAAFVPDLADTVALLQVAHRFLELRGEDLVGGLVVRSFEAYEPGEARTWWIDGRCALVTAHPDTPELAPPDDVDLTAIGAGVALLGSPFVVVDLAKTVTGQWRVVEVGDGQVSDRPSSLPAERLLRQLARGPVTR